MALAQEVPLTVTRPIAQAAAAVLLTLALVLGAGASGRVRPAGADPATTGFVTSSGTQLLVGGQPWKFTGYNLPCGQPFQLSDDALNFYLDNIKLNSSANVVRVWFFQSNGGPGNWAPFDRVIAALKGRGMRAIPTLVNEFPTCEPTTAEKTLDWYQGGYKLTGDGYPISFRDFATQVAAHYANEPAVAFWQLVNEAEAPGAQGGCDNTAAMNALRSFSDDVAGAIHTVDHNHLVDLGTQGSGQCGTNGSAAYTFVHAGALGLCEYHDYGNAGQAMPSDGNNLLKERIADCNSLNKPLFIGEAGIAGNVQPDGSEPPCPDWPNCSSPLTFQTLQQRATFFQAKITAANSAGVVGYVIWFKSPFYAPASDPFAIGDGDPTEAVLPAALTPTPTTAIPEARWPVLLLLPGMGLVAFVLFRRRHPNGLAPSEVTA
jgi:mannan endo-1,4-beta-mannosidase